jgi:hypothetical protein
VAVNLVISDETLLGRDNTPAVIEGHGPIPASVARNLVSDAATDERSKATLRRLYRHPQAGTLVAMESRQRCFPRGLAKFIGLRDQTCRTPYCDAPIRHRDHAQPRNRGGPTSPINGLGSCERCNYTKESPGWQITAAEDENGVHTTDPGHHRRRGRSKCGSAKLKHESASPSPDYTPPKRQPPPNPCEIAADGLPQVGSSPD